MTGRRRPLAASATYRGPRAECVAVTNAACALVLCARPAARRLARLAANAQSYEEALAKFAADSYTDTDAGIAGVAASGNPLAAQVIEALQDGRLLFSADDKKVYIREAAGRDCSMPRPASRSPAPSPPASSRCASTTAAPRHRGGARRPDAAVARPGQALRGRAGRVQVEGRQRAGRARYGASAKETDARVKKALQEARAAVILDQAGRQGGRPGWPPSRILRDRGDQDARGLLAGVPGDQPTRRPAGRWPTPSAAIDNRLAVWNVAQNLWYGLSLGSVLLLAAIGLAITFGVMGVINMAHGEMVMLGAYTTFVVQELIRTKVPGLFDYSLAIAIPLAFLVAALVGMAIERGVIRFLYGRPLETLLATWGISLILQQAVRTVVRADQPRGRRAELHVGRLRARRPHHHLEPAVDHRLRRHGLRRRCWRRCATPTLGLQMRAVTQNRRMASSMAIHTGRIDALTFALGSGIAGLAGVALSQIDNVSPNLGQSYIIDSFLVVVFGGVGNLWGTLVGAMSLGVANKFLEPYAGAVLGKIVLLVLVILFIQKRPRGLFALKGRAVEA